MATPYIGEIRMVGFTFAPAGWQLCQGQLLSISNFEALFNLIGTTYGGDGQNTFALPDLRSRIPIHQGTLAGGPTYVIGEQSGTETVTITTNQMPQHNHLLNAQSANGNQPSPLGGFWAGSPLDQYATGAPTTTMSASLVGLAGGSQPHDNMPPYLCVNFAIALFGIFPSRS
jgi:microcystin-dependent protein